MDPTFVTTVMTVSLCVVIPTMLIPSAGKIKALRSRMSRNVKGAFHATRSRTTPYGNEIVVEVDGVIMNDAKISKDLMTAMMDETADVLAGEDLKQGRCLVEKTKTLGLEGTPVDAVSWLLEATERPVVWEGLTDLNGTLIQSFCAGEDGMRLRLPGSAVLTREPDVLL